jgi:uncharacterized protein
LRSINILSIVGHGSSGHRGNGRRCGGLAGAVAGSLLALTLYCGTAQADPTMRQGIAALTHENFPLAAQIFGYLGQRGNAEAQTFMGTLYQTGRGVPQNYTQAAIWYRRAAEQGHPGAQQNLGLLYDKGLGVPQDNVEAQKWLILSTAGSMKMAAEDRARLRDAVRTKMTRGEIAQARMKALSWMPRPEW